MFSFNAPFSFAKKQFRLPAVPAAKSFNSKTLSEDRSIRVEAAIVRILKARKVMTLSELQAEVVTLLAYFKPKFKTIKQRLESLIGREFVRRDDDDSKVFHYMA